MADKTYKLNSGHEIPAIGLGMATLSPTHH